MGKCTTTINTLIIGMGHCTTVNNTPLIGMGEYTTANNTSLIGMGECNLKKDINNKYVCTHTYIVFEIEIQKIIYLPLYIRISFFQCIIITFPLTQHSFNVFTLIERNWIQVNIGYIL